MADQILCIGSKCPACGAMMTSQETRQGRVVMTEEVTGPDGKPMTKSFLQCPNPYCPTKQAGPPEDE